MKKRLLSMVLAGCMVLGIGTAAGASENDLTIGWYAPLVHDYFELVKGGVEGFASEYGVDVEYVYGSAETQAAENEKVEALAGKGIKNFLIYPMDADGANGLYSELVGNDCHVISYGSETNLPTDATFYVGPSVEWEVTTQIEKLMDLMGGSGKVLVILEALENPNIQKSREIIMQYAEEHPEFEIVQECAGMSSTETAVTKISDAISGNANELDGILAVGTVCSIGLARVMNDYYVTNPDAKHIYTVLNAVDSEIAEAIEKETIDIALYQTTYSVGYVSAGLLYLMNQGYEPKEDAYRIELNDIIVTKENVGKYNTEDAPLAKETYEKLLDTYFQEIDE